MEGQSVCLKCGAPAAGASCGACGNEILSPERHPLATGATKGQIAGYVSLAVAALLTVIVAGSAVLAVVSPSLKYVVKHHASAVCDCKDDACVQRESARAQAALGRATAELATAPTKVGAEGQKSYVDSELQDVAAAVVRLNACSKPGAK